MYARTDSAGITLNRYYASGRPSRLSPNNHQQTAHTGDQIDGHRVEQDHRIRSANVHSVLFYGAQLPQIGRRLEHDSYEKEKVADRPETIAQPMED